MCVLLHSGRDLILPPPFLCSKKWCIAAFYSQPHQQVVQICVTASQVASQMLTMVYWVAT